MKKEMGKEIESSISFYNLNYSIIDNNISSIKNGLNTPRFLSKESKTIHLNKTLLPLIKCN
jgi:hypothetical protein